MGAGDNGGGSRPGALATAPGLETEIGYGLPVGNRFVGTPRAGVTRSEYGQDYRLGYGLQVIERDNVDVELGVDAERRETPTIFHDPNSTNETQNRILGRATVRW